ncbi:MAG: hypothetical protein ONB25_04990 [candidate division KSB1 bacterium]|nr:hypothetical protein [candidate division KSB1 bacterium]
MLDWIYLHPGADSPTYLSELRLQHLERLELDKLLGLAEGSGRPKLKRAAGAVTELARAEAQEDETP